MIEMRADAPPPTDQPVVAPPTAPAAPTASRRAPVVALIGAVAVAIGATTVAAVRRAGTFSYTLDDPYIHLRVAEQISRGGYGINPGEWSAPASSALWPLLLAPFARWDAGIWAPLVIAGACTLASAALVLQIVAQGWRPLDPTGWISAGLAAAIVFASGLVAVAFTGMEHSLQIALALGALLGVSRVADGEPAPRWLWAVIAVAPLVRYEGVVVSAAAVVALLVFGERRRPIAALAVGLAGLAAFSGFLAAIGLSPVPASVLIKAQFAETSPGLLGKVETAGANWSWVLELGDLTGIALLATVALLAVALLAGVRALRREVTILAMAAVLLAVHISAFSHDGMMRYQLYAIATALAAVASALPAVAREANRTVAPGTLRSGFAGAALLVLVASLLNGGTGLLWLAPILVGVFVPLLAASARPLTRAGLVVATVVVIALAGTPMYERGTHVPDDAAAIAHQQHQMHRFVEAYDRPVAANDIGWVAYDADVDVLDLWGLASPEVREARAAAEPGWMDDLMAAEGVDVAMLYETWSADSIPGSWITVATLRTEPLGMLGGDEVTFYARSPEAAAQARAALAEIEPAMPAESRLAFA